MPAFPPLLGIEPKFLILGSMPGQASLDAQQYYAHPRNAFWPIMASLFSVPLAANYRRRVDSLTAAGVAVWDVLSDCERPGSLDSAIVRNSEKVNNFDHFFAQHPTISVVGFNGRSARTIFTRHCRHLYDVHTHIVWEDLPSSSPAHAALSLHEKQQIWRRRLLRI